jgi:hypothetical protein
MCESNTPTYIMYSIHRGQHIRLFSSHIRGTDARAPRTQPVVRGAAGACLRGHAAISADDEGVKV